MLLLKQCLTVKGVELGEWKRQLFNLLGPQMTTAAEARSLDLHPWVVGHSATCFPRRVSREPDGKWSDENSRVRAL